MPDIIPIVDDPDDGELIALQAEGAVDEQTMRAACRAWHRANYHGYHVSAAIETAEVEMAWVKDEEERDVDGCLHVHVPECDIATPGAYMVTRLWIIPSAVAD